MTIVGRSPPPKPPHEAAMAEADLSVLSIPPRIGSSGSDGVEAALCSVHGGKPGKSGHYLFQSVEPTCVALGTYQILAPHIKRQENQIETQLSVNAAFLHPQSTRVFFCTKGIVRWPSLNNSVSISFYPETLVFSGVRSGTKPNKNFTRYTKKRYQKN